MLEKEFGNEVTKEEITHKTPEESLEKDLTTRFYDLFNEIKSQNGMSKETYAKKREEYSNNKEYTEMYKIDIVRQKDLLKYWVNLKNIAKLGEIFEKNNWKCPPDYPFEKKSSDVLKYIDEEINSCKERIQFSETKIQDEIKKKIS